MFLNFIISLNLLLWSCIKYPQSFNWIQKGENTFEVLKKCIMIIRNSQNLLGNTKTRRNNTKNVIIHRKQNSQNFLPIVWQVNLSHHRPFRQRCPPHCCWSSKIHEISHNFAKLETTAGVLRKGHPRSSSAVSG